MPLAGLAIQPAHHISGISAPTVHPNRDLAGMHNNADARGVVVEAEPEARSIGQMVPERRFALIAATRRVDKQLPYPQIEIIALAREGGNCYPSAFEEKPLSQEVSAWRWSIRTVAAVCDP
jgi:hypothetical protein